MLRLKDVPVEEMPEVVRLASEMYEEDQARINYVAAAEEMGVPPEYLEKAAERLQQRKATQQQSATESVVYVPVARVRPVVPMLLASLALFIGLLLAYFLSSASVSPAPPMMVPPEQVIPVKPEQLTPPAPISR